MNIRTWWKNRAAPRDSNTWHLYRRQLDVNEHNEETLAWYLRVPNLISVGEAQRIVDKILELREDRVRILRRLGWTREADRLEADTALRRSWPPLTEESNPLTASEIRKRLRNRQRDS